MRKAIWIIAAVVVLLILAALGAFAYCCLMPGEPYESDRIPVLDEQGLKRRSRLQETVKHLSVTIGPRNLAHPDALQNAALFISGELQRRGLPVTEVSFDTEEGKVQNVAAELAGTAPGNPLIIVGAHYDAFENSPGANDNATGVAALLEIASALRAAKLKTTVRFVAFVNEEPPHFRKDTMGSRQYVKQALQGEGSPKVKLMLNLDMLGCYQDVDVYSFPDSLALGTKGDSLVFLGDLNTRSHLRRAIALFRQNTPLPSRAAALPRWVSGVADSDHDSFWRVGIPAIMVTDTGLRDCPYHTAKDELGQVDFTRLSLAVRGLAETVIGLANGRD